MNSIDLEQVLANNIASRRAFDAFLVSRGAMTLEQLAAKHVGVDFDALMTDNAFADQMEMFAINPKAQDYALDAQLRTALAESVAGLAAKIQAPDTSGATLCAASDAFTKISNLIDRRDAAKREGGDVGLYRHLSRDGNKVTIKSIEGVVELQLTERLTSRLLQPYGRASQMQRNGRYWPRRYCRH